MITNINQADGVPGFATMCHFETDATGFYLPSIDVIWMMVFCLPVMYFCVPMASSVVCGVCSRLQYCGYKSLIIVQNVSHMPLLCLPQNSGSRTLVILLCLQKIIFIFFYLLSETANRWHFI